MSGWIAILVFQAGIVALTAYARSESRHLPVLHVRLTYLLRAYLLVLAALLGFAVGDCVHRRKEAVCLEQSK